MDDFPICPGLCPGVSATYGKTEPVQTVRSLKKSIPTPCFAYGVAWVFNVRW